MVAKFTNQPTNKEVVSKINDVINDMGTVKSVNSTSPDSNGNVSLTIPAAANNGTLTIQKNGTTVKTFTANASSNVTCNITVPTNTNELTNGAGFVTTDTKNTAGSTDTSSKIFLVGATSQAANPQTYSQDTAFVDTSGQLNSANPAANTNSTVVATTKWVTDKGYTTNTGTVTSVNNVSPVNGNVSLTIPTVGNGTITINQGGVQKGTFTTNQSGNTTIDLDAGGGSGSYVSKSGDTMTGGLEVSVSGVATSTVRLKNTDLSRASNPSTQTWVGIPVVGSDGNSLGEFTVTKNTNGTTYAYIGAWNSSGSSANMEVGWNSSGNAYCTFPNTTRVDGQWVQNFQEAVGSSAYSLAKSTAHAWTFSSLPAANCEVLLSYRGGSQDVTIYSDLIYTDTMRATGTASGLAACLILPVSSSKKIYLKNMSSSTAVNISFFRIFGYRKIGSNAQ